MKLTTEQKRVEFSAARRNYLSAKASGSRIYLGTECRHPGHGREKYVVSRHCVACSKFYTLNVQRPEAKRDPEFLNRRRRWLNAVRFDREGLLALLAAGV